MGQINKIFQIGFNKCATVSMAHLFTENGLRSLHWRWKDGESYKYAALEMKRNFDSQRPLLQGMEDYDFYSDLESHLGGFEKEDDDYFPCIYAHIDYYRELDKQYPNSKFILNYRNVSNWIDSRKRHVFGSGRTYIDSHMYHMDLTSEQVVSLWEEQWNKHLHDVRDYFKDRSKDLLVFNIEEDYPTKIKHFFSEYVDLDLSHWLKLNTGRIPIDFGTRKKKKKKDRIILWEAQDHD